MIRFLRVLPEVQLVAAGHPERSSRVVPAAQSRDASTAPFGFTPRTNAGSRSGCSRVFRTAERGQGTLEFFLTLPLVMTLLFGIMEFGIVVFSYSTIANAAQEGARYGALHPAAVSGTCANPGAGIGDAVCRLTAGLHGNEVRYTATVDAGILRVAVTYRYQAVSGPVAQAVGEGGTLALSASAATLIE